MRRKGEGMLGTRDHRRQPQASEVALGRGEGQQTGAMFCRALISVLRGLYFLWQGMHLFIHSFVHSFTQCLL